MLQKGFLKSSREDQNEIRAVKNSRTFLFAGVIAVLLAFMYMITQFRQDNIHSSVMIAGILMIAGIVLISIGTWMNFFSQNKKRRRAE